MADKALPGAPGRSQRATGAAETAEGNLGRIAGSWASTPAIRRTMQGNRGRDTGPELAVRRLLHATGLRYRVNYRAPFIRRRSIDIAFTKPRLACFIDGCFWHGCPEHYKPPRTNADFWRNKVDRNRLRDDETNEMLRSTGWVVVRFWQHEPPDRSACEIRRILALLDAGMSHTRPGFLGPSPSTKTPEITD